MPRVTTLLSRRVTRSAADKTSALTTATSQKNEADDAVRHTRYAAAPKLSALPVGTAQRLLQHAGSTDERIHSSRPYQTARRQAQFRDKLCSMKAGLRLQILLLLGGLMLLAFVPLFFSVATYTKYTLKQIRESNARSLGRAVAGHVAEARARRSPSELMGLLDAEVGTAGVEAIGVYDPRGVAVARVGDPVAVDAIEDRRADSRGRVRGGKCARRAIAVAVPDERGSSWRFSYRRPSRRVRPARAPGRPLTGLVALLLLVLAYFALTRLIVRPARRAEPRGPARRGGARRSSCLARARRALELGTSLQRR